MRSSFTSSIITILIERHYFFFRKLSFYANLTCITFYKPTTYIKTCFITYEILQILEVFYCTSEKYEVYLQRQTNKECKFEQQESWRLQKPLTTYLIGKCSC